MINICIPTLNRYDLLTRCIDSLENGSLVPDHYYVIDNGCKIKSSIHNKVHVYSAGRNIGCAANVNWFLKNVKQFRLYTNDDIEFGKFALEQIYEASQINDITCLHDMDLVTVFNIKDSVIDLVGYFDESISPNYCYFEDNDFGYRLKLAGYKGTQIQCNVLHLKSSTMKQYTQEELDAHHDRFRIAERNYLEKWGGLPENEAYTSPYNSGRSYYVPYKDNGLRFIG